jgi:hypothetical protein
MRASLVALVVLVACSGKADECDTPIDSRTAAACERACNDGNAESCDALGYYYNGSIYLGRTDGGFRHTGPRDPARAREYWKRACDLGYKRSCDELR